MDNRQLFEQGLRFRNMIMLSILMSLNGFSYANEILDDNNLAEQTDQLQKVTPEVIIKVKTDVELNLEQQLQLQQNKAQVNAKQIKKDILEAHAASDYEIKRKTDPDPLMRVEKHEFFPEKQ